MISSDANLPPILHDIQTFIWQEILENTAAEHQGRQTLDTSPQTIEIIAENRIFASRWEERHEKIKTDEKIQIICYFWGWKVFRCEKVANNCDVCVSDDQCKKDEN